jgi:lambda family phage portal protein
MGAAVRFRSSLVTDEHGRPFLVASEPAYRSAGQGRQFVGMHSSPISLNTALLGGLSTLRARVRDLLRNDPMVWKAVRNRVSNLVGTGITPRAQWRDNDKRAEVHQLWADSVPELGAETPSDFYALQALAVRETIAAGECFLRLRRRLPVDGLAVPMQVQVLAADFVPVWKNETLDNGNRIKAGVEYDALGRRVAYHVHRSHPGEYFGGETATLTRVPAAEMLHLFEVLEPGQIRGEPAWARAIKMAHTLGNARDAIVQRMAVAAVFAGFITAPEGQDPLETAGEDEPTLEPGRLNRLEPGEAITFPDMPDTGGNYDAFVRDSHMALAASGDVTYEGLTGDLSRVNFSSIRAGLVEFRRQCEQVQYHTIIPCLRGVWREWITQAVTGGAIDLPAFGTPAGRREAFRVEWQPEAWPWVDPEADVAAYEKAIELGITSRRRVIVATGNDPDEIRRERQQDAAEDEADGVTADEPMASAAFDPSEQRTAERARQRRAALRVESVPGTPAVVNA